MGSKRKFERFCNRSMPIMTAQYWYRGERYGLGKIINDVDYYNPLFVYKKNKGVDIYYESDNGNEDNVLVSCFKNNPKKFEILAKKYKRECNKMLSFIIKAKPKDFSKIFNLHVSFWPKLCLMISLGDLLKQKRLRIIAQHAYKLRKQTEKVEYLSGNNLLALANQILPDLSEFIYFLTFEEIRSGNIPSRKELLKRKEGYIYFEDKIYTDLALKDFKKKKRISFKKERMNEIIKKDIILSGDTAMKGRAKGKVRVIFEEYQLSRVKDGDILVTAMTTPDYIFAMKKAAAFVTNEGGITCHAAIVAREMKKPCIIGTKNATKILRNGDFVEVNANKGVVKILKKR